MVVGWLCALTSILTGPEYGDAVHVIRIRLAALPLPRQLKMILGHTPDLGRTPDLFHTPDLGLARVTAVSSRDAIMGSFYLFAP